MANNTIAIAEHPRKVSGTAGDPRPSEQEIAARAHELFLERGCVEGHDMDDWLRAEIELVARKKGLIV